MNRTLACRIAARLIPVSTLLGGAMAQAAAPTAGTVPAGVTANATIPAGTVQIVYVNAPGHPKNLVPGLGVAFKPGGTSTSAFLRPWFSDDESQFLIEAFANVATTADDVYLLNNTLLLQEGTPAPWNPAENVSSLLDDDVGLDNAGRVLITQGTSAASTINDIVALYSGGVWTEIAREGGLVDPFVPSLAGATWDDLMDTPRLGGGQPLWHADGVDFTPANTVGDDFYLMPGGSILRESFTVPIGLAGGATDTWENFTAGETYVNNSGTLVLTLGDTTAATTTDQILTLNNVVLLQENVVIPGSSFTQPIDNANGIVQAWLDNAGNWWARGNNDNPASTTIEQDWVVRNGVVIAVSNDPLDPRSQVIPGSGEHWEDTGFTDCFFAMDGSLSGAWVIGGVTDFPDAQRDGVLLFDDGFGNRAVVAREGDPIDMNGNGFFDDDRFFSTFGNDDVILLESGDVVFTATLRNGAGTSTDQGVFKVRPGAASCLMRNGTGINPAEFQCLSAPVLGANVTFGLTPNPNTAATIIVLANGPFPPTPLFGGEALVDLSTFELYLGSGNQTIPVPPNPMLLGVTAWLQGGRFDVIGGVGTVVLLNAIDATIGL